MQSVMAFRLFLYRLSESLNESCCCPSLFWCKSRREVLEVSGVVETFFHPIYKTGSVQETWKFPRRVCLESRVQSSARKKRWLLYILPQHHASLTQPINYKESHIFAIFVPVLTTLCVILGLKLLELFCTFLWASWEFLCVKNYE